MSQCLVACARQLHVLGNLMLGFPWSPQRYTVVHPYKYFTAQFLQPKDTRLPYLFKHVMNELSAIDIIMHFVGLLSF